MGVFESDSDETVIEGEKILIFFETADEDAGNFKYLCMMPICTLEDSDNGLELAGHFHFNYGSTNGKSNKPQWDSIYVDDDITEEEKATDLMWIFPGQQE